MWLLLSISPTLFIRGEQQQPHTRVFRTYSMRRRLLAVIGDRNAQFFKLRQAVLDGRATPYPKLHSDSSTKCIKTLLGVERVNSPGTNISWGLIPTANPIRNTHHSFMTGR